jgi:hypothetical protein
MQAKHQKRSARYVMIAMVSALLWVTASSTHADECTTNDDCPGGVCVTELDPNVCSSGEEGSGRQGDPCDSDSDCQGVCDLLEGTCEGDCKWNQDCPEGAYCQRVDNVCQWE